MNKKIAPPFPFPNLWDSARNFQVVHNCAIWSVPTYSVSSIVPRPFEGSTDSTYGFHFPPSDSAVLSDTPDTIRDICEEGDCILEDNEESEILVMNEVWIERLSKALKRKQKKVYKSNQKNK